MAFTSVQEGESFVPQSESLYGMESNRAGGYSYKVDDLTRFMRFLVLGADGGTYYYGEKELKRENVQSLDRLVMSGRGTEVVDRIYEVSTEGRSCKQNTCLYALSLCARSNDPDTKLAAYKILPEVCRIPTHLFMFIDFCENESAGTGWGRAHRRAIGKWYNSFEKEPEKLANLVTKYQSRNRWSHVDVIRLSHIKPTNHEVGFIIRYIAKDLQEACRMYCPQNPNNPTPVDPSIMKIKEFLQAVDMAKTCNDEDKMVDLIRNYNLVREHVPTELLRSKKVWGALLQKMPMTALIRNLGRMSNLNLLKDGSENEDKVVKKLRDQNYLQHSRIHPFNVLVALKQYKLGHGDKGKLKWVANENIVAALDDAFYLSFINVTPTGKRYLLAVDVSGSMNCPVMGNASITARDAAAAMMMVTARVEEIFEVVAFAKDISELPIKAEDTLSDVIGKCQNHFFSGTDCARPMMYAMEKKKQFDVFIVYTDSETYYGNIHPSEAIKRYREYAKIPDAKLIVAGMASNSFSIADPNDRFMMDIVGFDSAAPQAIECFVNGKAM